MRERISVFPISLYLIAQLNVKQRNAVHYRDAGANRFLWDLFAFDCHFDRSCSTLGMFKVHRWFGSTVGNWWGCMQVHTVVLGVVMGTVYILFCCKEIWHLFGTYYQSFFWCATGKTLPVLYWQSSVSVTIFF